MNPKWTHKGQRNTSGPNFEIAIDIGSHDPEATGILMAAVMEVVARKAQGLFPPSEQPQHKPCKGCPDGLMQAIPKEFQRQA